VYPSVETRDAGAGQRDGDGVRAGYEQLDKILAAY
jgi:hypothetical protein